jgi:hypothetical protein
MDALCQTGGSQRHGTFPKGTVPDDIELPRRDAVPTHVGGMRLMYRIGSMDGQPGHSHEYRTEHMQCDYKQSSVSSERRVQHESPL